MIKKSVFLIIGVCLLLACKKPESLIGKSFHLINGEPSVDTSSKVIMFRFINSREVEIWIIRDFLESKNKYVRTPYKFEDNFLSVQGATYEAKKNKGGYDLYKGTTLAYKLITPDQGKINKMVENSIKKQKNKSKALPLY